MKKEATKKDAHKKDSAPIKIAEPFTVDRCSRTNRTDEGKAMRLAVPLEAMRNGRRRPIPRPHLL